MQDIYQVMVETYKHVQKCLVRLITKADNE